MFKSFSAKRSLVPDKLFNSFRKLFAGCALNMNTGLTSFIFTGIFLKAVR